MKKHLLIIVTLLTYNTIFAQIDKIVGNWSETWYVRTDTLDSGREKLNNDYKAYVKGYKKLDPESDTMSYVFIPEVEDRIKVTFTKEEDYFWATYNEVPKIKIAYVPGFQEYLITLQKYLASYSYIVKYDPVTDKITFLDHRSKEICHEFERIK